MGDAQLTKDDFETFVEIGGRIVQGWNHLAAQNRNAAQEARAGGDKERAAHESDRAEQADDRADDVSRAVRLAARFADGLPD